MTELFTTERKPAKRKAAPKPPVKPAAGQLAVAAWIDTWKHWKHAECGVLGPEAKQLKIMAQSYPSERLKRMMEAYFNERHPCPTIGWFYRNHAKYAAMCPVEVQRDPQDELAELEAEK